MLVLCLGSVNMCAKPQQCSHMHMHKEEKTVSGQCLAVILGK